MRKQPLNEQVGAAGTDTHTDTQAHTKTQYFWNKLIQASRTATTYFSKL